MPDQPSPQSLARRSFDLRIRLLRAISQAGAGHTGGGLSCLDILHALYRCILRIDPANPGDPARDRYVQSKGHCVEALYTVLAECGFIPDSALDTICRFRSPFIGHPTRKIPGIEMNTGALGHGLPICVGMALAAKMDAAPFRVFTLLGDGELAEGSNWEAALAASHHRLDNLVAILDHNSLQITGPTRDVLATDPVDEKFRAFGWDVRHADGHDYAALIHALQTPPAPGKPLLLIAATTKGKGVSFMENVPAWHHRVPSRDELAAAIAELESARDRTP